MRCDALPVAAIALGLIATAGCTGSGSGPADAARSTGKATHPVESAAPSPATVPSQLAWPEPGCPPIRHTRHAATVDWADFIQWDDRSYIRISRRVTAKRVPARFVGTVNCQVTTLATGPHDVVVGPIRNGNASSLPAGTRLYASRADPHCVLLARVDGGWAYWIAHGCDPKLR